MTTYQMRDAIKRQGYQVLMTIDREQVIVYREGAESGYLFDSMQEAYDKLKAKEPEVVYDEKAAGNTRLVSLRYNELEALITATEEQTERGIKGGKIVYLDITAGGERLIRYQAGEFTHACGGQNPKEAQDLYEKIIKEYN